jgi:16S rRNA (guanine1516-N2)-methyltransferase
MFEIKLLRPSLDKLESLQTLIPKEIHLSVVVAPPEDSFYLFYTDTGLQLGFTHAEFSDFSPLSFDWVTILKGYKSSFFTRSVKDESFYKALGLNKNPHPVVADATLGTGKDTLFLAYLGAQVISYERNPWVYLLASDALKRLHENHEWATLANKIEIRFGSINSSWDYIYYDPMFPEKKKSALPPKEMQIFKKLVGDDQDQIKLAAELLALTKARLLVKRPTWAEPILPKPHMSYESKLMRVDTYVKAF